MIKLLLGFLLSVTAMAAQTGVVNSVPFWKTPFLLGQSNCTWNPGTLAWTCSGNPLFSALGFGAYRQLGVTPTGLLDTRNVEIIAALVYNSGGGVINSCTVSPCQVDQDPNNTNHFGFASATRGGTGSYTINFTPGFWVTVPHCAVMSRRTPQIFTVCNTATTTISTTTLTITCFETDGGSTNQDSAFDIVCGGGRGT